MIRMNKTKNLKRDERMKCKHLIVRFESVMPDKGEMCTKGWSLSPERCNENCPDYEPIEENKQCGEDNERSY
jgi:hypothetical protein